MDAKNFYNCYNFLKGYNFEVDSYSAFFNNGGFENTEMEAELDRNEIGKVYVVGIALDYCVFYSAMDSQKLGKDFFRYGCKTLPDFIFWKSLCGRLHQDSSALPGLDGVNQIILN